MRQLLLISFISVHLLGNTEINQVFKLPNLIDHFFEHHRIDRDLNFFEFLAMHYGGDDGTDADNDKDNQLPCHDLRHNTLSVVCCQIVQDAPVLEIITEYTSKKYGKLLLIDLPPKNSSTLIQPPRQA
ncbi:MAG: hypothetical protein JNK14_07280 [Chitinophagaceae bacterium]|nr:hypothetical protein [Chitinophagaceae bacterium]